MYVLSHSFWNRMQGLFQSTGRKRGLPYWKNYGEEIRYGEPIQNRQICQHVRLFFSKLFDFLCWAQQKILENKEKTIKKASNPRHEETKPRKGRIIMCEFSVPNSLRLVFHFCAIGDAISGDAPCSAIGFRGKPFFVIGPAIVGDSTGNTVRQGYCYTCLGIGEGISVGSLSRYGCTKKLWRVLTIRRIKRAQNVTASKSARLKHLSSTELESGNALGAFLQTLSPSTG